MDSFIQETSNLAHVSSIHEACLIKAYNIVYVHCREEGCIGKYIPRGPRDFPRAGILHPEAQEIAEGNLEGRFEGLCIYVS